MEQRATGSAADDDGWRLQRDAARAVLENTAALMCVLDADARVLLFNRACEELTGWRADEVLGRPIWDTVVVTQERELARREIAEAIAQRVSVVLEGTWRDRRGGEHRISFHNTVLLDEEGVPDRMVCVGVDVTEQRRAEAELRRLASTDVLTGLLNRRALFDALDEALAPSEAGGCGVLYCDLDGFKAVNDALGHAAGDALLAEVGDRLRAAVREGDLVARVGGDEFVVLCPGADGAALQRVTDRVRAAVTPRYEVAGGRARIGVSIGMSVAPSGTPADEALSGADRRMYAAKSRRPA